MPAMSIMATAQKLARHGRHREAVAVVEQAASTGDGEALLTLAYWRLFGVHGPRDHALAHEHLRKAAAAGNQEAARTRAYLIGNGTGCPAAPERAAAMLEELAAQDPASTRQLAFLKQMPPVSCVQGLGVDVRCETPSVRLVRGLLNVAECRYLCELAEPALQPSSIIDPRSGRPIPHPIRTSEGMNIGPTQEDLVVQAINRRLAAATGTEFGFGEPLHILRYSPGQEYRPHVDALPGVANQRQCTVLIYLNTGYLGGATHFPELGLTERGDEGDALIFRNILPDGRTDQRTRHAGLPVTSGVKWLATRWIRSRPYSPWEPEGR